VKAGDLVRDRQLYSIGSYYRYDYDDEYPEYVLEATLPKPTAVFIKWHIVDGEEDGEFYSCAKVLWSQGGIGNILRHNLAVVSEGR
jgi:hypothetical protein